MKAYPASIAGPAFFTFRAYTEGLEDIDMYTGLHHMVALCSKEPVENQTKRFPRLTCGVSELLNEPILKFSRHILLMKCHDCS